MILLSFVIAVVVQKFSRDSGWTWVGGLVKLGYFPRDSRGSFPTHDEREIILFKSMPQVKRCITVRKGQRA